MMGHSPAFHFSPHSRLETSSFCSSFGKAIYGPAPTCSQSGCVWQATNWCFPLTSMSFSVSLPSSLPLSLEAMRVKTSKNALHIVAVFCSDFFKGFPFPWVQSRVLTVLPSLTHPQAHSSSLTLLRPLTSLLILQCAKHAFAPRVLYLTFFPPTIHFP